MPACRTLRSQRRSDSLPRSRSNALAANSIALSPTPCALVMRSSIASISARLLGCLPLAASLLDFDGGSADSMTERSCHGATASSATPATDMTAAPARPRAARPCARAARPAPHQCVCRACRAPTCARSHPPRRRARWRQHRPPYGGRPCSWAQACRPQPCCRPCHLAHLPALGTDAPPSDCELIERGHTAPVDAYKRAAWRGAARCRHDPPQHRLPARTCRTGNTTTQTPPRVFSDRPRPHRRISSPSFRRSRAQVAALAPQLTNTKPHFSAA